MHNKKSHALILVRFWAPISLSLPGRVAEERSGAGLESTMSKTEHSHPKLPYV